MTDAADSNPRHFTLWPSFAVIVGLMVLALYFLWAAYGAAPTSLRFLTETPTEHVATKPTKGTEKKGMAMAGHGAGVSRMTPDEFRKITTKFVEDLSLPDGSVRPTRQWTEAMRKHGIGEQPNMDAARSKDHRALDPADAVEPADAHKPADADKPADAHKTADADEPVDVYLMAMRFQYEPRVLLLKRGVRYRFRMMSMDVNHGASIHTGFAGHIMRRPAGVMMEMEMTFSEPGEFMVYCTVYCGLGHDKMKGKIIVK